MIWRDRIYEKSKKKNIAQMTKDEFVEHSKRISGWCILNSEFVRNMLYDFLKRAMKSGKATNVEEKI